MHVVVTSVVREAQRTSLLRECEEHFGSLLHLHHVQLACQVRHRRFGEDIALSDLQGEEDLLWHQHVKVFDEPIDGSLLHLEHLLGQCCVVCRVDIGCLSLMLFEDTKDVFGLHPDHHVPDEGVKLSEV